MAQANTTPPSNWQSITIDIVVDGTTTFLDEVGKTAQEAILGSLKQGGSVIEAVAGSHAYVAVGTLRVGGVGVEVIRLTVAVDSGDPNVVAKYLFSLSVGEGVGFAAGLGASKVFKNPWIVGASSVVTGVVAGNAAESLWDSSVTNTQAGQWAKSTVTSAFDLNVRVVPNSTAPATSPTAQTSTTVVTPNTGNKNIVIDNQSTNTTTTISSAPGQS
ncbi:MAG: hypothetical protein ACXWT7_05485, partial [Methylophilaceae bacterium]